MASFIRTIRKLFVSTFVVVTFVAYALHERFINPNGNIDAAALAPPVAAITRQVPSPRLMPASPVAGSSPAPLAKSSTSLAPVAAVTATPEQLALAPTSTDQPSPTATDQPQSTATNQPLPTATDQPLPTATDQPLPTATAIANRLYKDGTYTGAETDAYYGLVQVQAVIQNGQIADVQFLEYPQHRRTSVRINSEAVPALQTEAIQAQSANVDMVSGATLTSRAFIQSLQSALDAAKVQQS